ncbi:hypothetical protein BDR06DRAFT_123224 [Suillus hirtellus]|nr:hypothetical protein BDR06DRAFT_123224 [Suillus hirtellus]
MGNRLDGHGLFMDKFKGVGMQQDRVLESYSISGGALYGYEQKIGTTTILRQPKHVGLRGQSNIQSIYSEYRVLGCRWILSAVCGKKAQVQFSEVLIQIARYVIGDRVGKDSKCNQSTCRKTRDSHVLGNSPWHRPPIVYCLRDRCHTCIALH